MAVAAVAVARRQQSPSVAGWLACPVDFHASGGVN
jgi:hypothetical protein